MTFILRIKVLHTLDQVQQFSTGSSSSTLPNTNRLNPSEVSVVESASAPGAFHTLPGMCYQQLSFGNSCFLIEQCVVI